MLVAPIQLALTSVTAKCSIAQFTARVEVNVKTAATDVLVCFVNAMTLIRVSSTWIVW